MYKAPVWWNNVTYQTQVIDEYVWENITKYQTLPENSTKYQIPVIDVQNTPENSTHFHTQLIDNENGWMKIIHDHIPWPYEHNI